MLVSACSLIGGGISQTFVQIPVLGYLVGSFVGSVVGSFVYSMGYNAVISFCVNTGFTLFGLVDQNYRLPDEIIESIGIEVFRYEKLAYEKFEPEKIPVEEFRPQRIELESLSIKILRRGVIGVRRIGYL